MAKTIYTYLHNDDLNGSRAVYIGNCFRMLFKTQKKLIKDAIETTRTPSTGIWMQSI